METEEKLKSIILDVLQSDVNKVGESTSFLNYENWDSMNFMLFVMDVERVFDISLTNTEIVEMTSYSKTLIIINQKIFKASEN
jgi:acyl carrier protein